MEAVALLRVEAGGGLVHDDEARVAEQGLGNAEALLHAAGVAAHMLLAHVVEVGLVQQGGHHLLALAAVGNAFEGGKMVEQLLGAHARVHAKFLRQVAQHAAHGLFVMQHVDVVELNGAGVGVL